MPEYLAVMNGFNALYLIADGMFQPLTLAQCQQWLPGVNLCETGSNGENIRVLAEMPVTRNKGMICVRITNPRAGPKSNHLFGFKSTVSADDAMAQLGRHISGAGDVAVPVAVPIAEAPEDSSSDEDEDGGDDSE